MSRWRQCSDLAPSSPLAPPPGAADSSVEASGLSGKTKRLLRGVGSLVARSSFHHSSEDTGGLRSSGGQGGVMLPAPAASGRKPSRLVDAMPQGGVHAVVQGTPVVHVHALHPTNHLRSPTRSVRHGRQHGVPSGPAATQWPGFRS